MAKKETKIKVDSLAAQRMICQSATNTQALSDHRLERGSKQYLEHPTLRQFCPLRMLHH
jgi:hypothetical protein